MRLVSIMLALLAIAAPSFAAPIRPVEVAVACGRVVQATFAAERFVRGMPGVSGTLGIDRTVPAGFTVVIDQYTGISAQLAAQANGAFSFQGGSKPRRVMFRLNSNDPQLFTNVQTMCVRGYVVNGDEGGTWATFRELIRNPPSIADPG